MDPHWIEHYVRFVLRLNRAIVQQLQSDYLLDYYGPPELQSQIAQEPIATSAVLLAALDSLRDTLTAQAISAERARYLNTLLRAYEIMCRRVAGERIPLREQVRASFDVEAEWVPETEFERAHALYDEALRGDGTIAERLARWKAHYTIPADKAPLIPTLMQQAVRESHRRTSAIIPLPLNDTIEIEPIHGQPVRAMAHYLGNHQARILMNPEVPFNVADLLYVVCHESYPGHLAELTLKEHHLLHEQRYEEQQVSFLITPPFVLSEGIALWAQELVFPGATAEAWLTEHIYPQVGITSDGSDLKAIQNATDLLFGVSCNAALMLEDGYGETDVLDYLQRYSLVDETKARGMLAPLQRPYFEAYIFTYYVGKQRLTRALSGENRHRALIQLLTEQRLPSDFV